MYLFGVCEGGMRALSLAGQYPGVFATIRAYGPALGQDNDPQSLNGTPVKIVEGEFDDVPPREVSDALFCEPAEG